MNKVYVELSVCVLTGLTLAIQSYGSEIPCDFDKRGNCFLNITQKTESMDTVSNIPRPGVADSINLNPERSFNEIAQYLRELESYIRTVQGKGIRLQTFDAKMALEKGFPEDMVLMVQELVNFQNDMLKVMVAGEKDVMSMPIDAVKYPRLLAYFAMKPEGKPAPIVSQVAIEPCGELSYPVPDQIPKRYPGTSSDPAQTLLNMGFHYTWGYACGDYVEIDCDHDFTQGAWNFGPYGYCDKPRFRMHGATDPDQPTWYSMHGPEPNPELNSYVWPYQTWGYYVYWWHHTF